MRPLSLYPVLRTMIFQPRKLRIGCMTELYPTLTAHVQLTSRLQFTRNSLWSNRDGLKIPQTKQI